MHEPYPGVCGRGTGEEGRLIRWSQLGGDLGRPEVWRILDELLFRPGGTPAAPS